MERESLADAWRGLGTFIGSHMAYLSPACLALGVLFPDELAFLRPFVTVLFAFMTFQSSLANDLGDLAHAARHPGPLLVTLAVSAVLMPSLACLLASALFGQSPDIVCGVVLEYSVPVAVVSMMWINLFAGDAALGLATLLVSTLAAPVTIPLTLQLLLGQTVAVDVAGMMGDMLVQIALPALAGTLVNDRTHGWGHRVLQPAIGPAAKLGLLLVIMSNSTQVAPFMRALTPALVAVIAFVGCVSSLGYVLGFAVARILRRDTPTAVTMTFQCGMRNISAGAVIAAQYFPGETMFPVMMGTLFQQILAAAAGSVMRRVLGAADGK